MRGVKILFECRGIFTSPSLYQIILQLSSALGLLIAASAITDGVMLNLLKEKNHYKQLKITQSEDMNEDD